MKGNNGNFTEFIISFEKNPAKADVIVLFTQNSTRLSNKEIKNLTEVYKACNQDGWKTIFKLIDYGYTISDPESHAFAQSCKKLTEKYPLPVVASWKVALAMVCALTPCWINDHKDNILCVFPAHKLKRIDSLEEFYRSLSRF